MVARMAIDFIWHEVSSIVPPGRVRLIDGSEFIAVSFDSILFERSSST
jgi:hypothetical protein